MGIDAHAHGFGQRYDLPVPLSLYLTGAAAVVLAHATSIAKAIQAAALRQSATDTPMKWQGISVSQRRSVCLGILSPNLL